MSRPSSRPATGKIAVKVINHYDDEVMKVHETASAATATTRYAGSGQPELLATDEADRQ